MTVSTGTSAGNFWEDGFEEEAECERFLQEQKTKIIEDEEEHVVEAAYDDEEEADDDEEEEVEEQEPETDAAKPELVAEADDAEEVAEEKDSEETEPVAEGEEEAEATNPEKGRKMAKTKTKAGGKTKAEAIREVIDRRKRASESLRPRDIIEELSDNGFEVNASQVSVTLRSMGVPPAPKGRVKGSKVKPTEAPAEPKSRVALKRGVSGKEVTKPAARNGELEVVMGQPASPAAIVKMGVEFLDAAGSYASAIDILSAIDSRFE
jgi:hypothetical protein